MQKLAKIIKNNYELLYCFALLVIILVVAISPKRYIWATQNGLTVWAKIVLPSLFLFFVLTKAMLSMPASKRIFAILDKPFGVVYGTQKYGGYVFFMSIIAGYPIGAKLIEELDSTGNLTQKEAKSMIAYCSSSGPMFIIGSISSQMFGNIKLGIVMYFSHILSCLINGLIYKNKSKNSSIDIKIGKINLKNAKNEQKTGFDLNKIMYDSILSILMVGGYISICFAGIEVLDNFLSPIKMLLMNNSAYNIIAGCIKGVIEVTTGCVSLSKICVDVRLLCVVLTSLVTFGGLSIHLQSQMFLSKAKIKYGYFLKIKLTQTIIAAILSFVVGSLLL